MDQITDLRELLKHELKDLYSAETQIIETLPKMIEKAKNPQLKKVLSDHLKVTRDQKKRLEKIQDLLNIVNETKEDGGFFANLFKSNEGEQHCKAMEGLIKEGESLMKEDMEPDVLDAAIIAAAQKIEHYEIGSYGTARAYAEQMGMTEVEGLLRLTLDEEYFADNSLTKIAVEKVNIVAEGASGAQPTENIKDKSKSNGRQLSAFSSGSSGKSSDKKTRTAATKSSPVKPAVKKTAPKKSAAKKAAPKKATAKKVAPKKEAPRKSAAKKAAPKKAVSKKTAPKKAAAKNAIPKRSVVKKSPPKKSVTKKVATKKSVSRSTAKKTAQTKASTSRASVKKSAPRKASATKSAPKKTAAKKISGNRPVVRKGTAKKAAPKKSVRQGTASRKVAPKKSSGKKSAPKKSSRRR